MKYTVKPKTENYCTLGDLNVGEYFIFKGQDEIRRKINFGFDPEDLNLIPVIHLRFGGLCLADPAEQVRKVVQTQDAQFQIKDI
jgi:hypothetical protein